MNDKKPFYQSKTIGFNVFAPLIFWGLAQAGMPQTPEMAMAVMALGNIVLRFITDTAVKRK